jgi:tetratricopeptide (TPR) repeat protein
MAENDQPFSDRSFVSPVMRDTEKMAVFPDNRPMQPHVFITNVMNITKEDIDSTFSKLYTPWKPEQPMYTVKDWRRSVMFSELPTSPPVVPSVSDMIHSSRASNNDPTDPTSPIKSSTPNNKVSTSSAKRKGKRTGKPRTPYLERPPRLLNSRATKKTPRSPRSSRSHRALRSPRTTTIHSSLSPSSTLPNRAATTTATTAAAEDETPETKQEPSLSSPPPLTRNNAPSIDSLELKSQQCLLNRKYLLAVHYQRKAIDRVTKLFGLSSQKIRGSCEKYIVMCNSTAMKMLDLKQYQLSLELLEKASDLTQRNGPLQRHQEARMKLRATTMNNLGCYWKNKREYGRALKFLQKATALETKMMATSANCDSPATTHLNICSVLSALGRHAQARDHACAALQVLDIEMDRAIQGGGDIGEAEQKSMKLRITALYNKAVEEMWLFQYKRAEHTYLEGLDEFDEDGGGGGGGGSGGGLVGLEALRDALREGLKEAQFKIRSQEEERVRMDTAKEKKLRFRREGGLLK